MDEITQPPHVANSRKKTAWVSGESSRPFFVAEADFKPSRLLAQKVRQALLVLQGADLLVLQAAQGGSLHPGGDADNDGAHLSAAASVVKHVQYTELLEVSVVGANSIKVKHSCSITKARISTSLRNLSLPAAGTSDGGNSTCATSAGQSEAGSSSSGGSSDISRRSLPAAAAAARSPVRAGAPTSLKVSCDSFTLYFKDAAAAHRAAAALLFQRAQHAAVQQWLSQGLHAGFRCEPVSCLAVPLQEARPHTPAASSYSQATSSGGSSSNGCCYVTSWGGAPPLDAAGTTKAHDRLSAYGSGGTAGSGSNVASAGAAAAMARVPASSVAGCTPWAGLEPSWGCTVPIPASWHPFLQAAASSAASSSAASSHTGTAAASVEPELTLDDLSCPVSLSEGPAALQLSITTPYGLAQATIEPQHVRAALLSSECSEILAVPATGSCKTELEAAVDPDRSRRRPVGFSWTVSSELPVEPQLRAGLNKQGKNSSSRSLGTASVGSSRRTSFTSESGAAGDALPLLAAAAAAAASQDARRNHLPVQHTAEVYAAVRLAVVRSQAPHVPSWPLCTAAPAGAQLPSSQVVEPCTPQLNLRP